MAFAVELLQEERLVYARWYGATNRNDARAAVDKIRTEVRAHPVEGILLDFRDAPVMLTLDTASDVRTEFAKFLGRRRLAFLTASPAHEQMLRFGARRAAPAGIHIEVFRDEDAAVEWLQRPDTE